MKNERKQFSEFDVLYMQNFQRIVAMEMAKGWQKNMN